MDIKFDPHLITRCEVIPPETLSHYQLLGRNYKFRAFLLIFVELYLVM